MPVRVFAVLTHTHAAFKYPRSLLISAYRASANDRALRSLTIVPYNDEHSADLYAADIPGNDTPAPFGKLEIADGEQRIEDLSRSGRNLHSGTFFERRTWLSKLIATTAYLSMPQNPSN
jgi:hypothetical protein